MKNPALQRKNLYNKNEVEYSHKMAIYQGMAMVFVTLEWHYGWKQKRLNRLFENLQSIAEIQRFSVPVMKRPNRNVHCFCDFLPAKAHDVPIPHQYP